MQSGRTFLSLSPNCSLRLLETPCVYDRAHDELYELDGDAAGFVRSLPLCVNDPLVARADREFVEYCLGEGLFRWTAEQSPSRESKQSPIPSLRYLLLHITTRCNLRCAHCYLGDVEPRDLPLEDIVRAMEQFDELQGLRLLVTGGEPLLHPLFWEANERFRDYSFRTVILSNGTVIDRATAERLRAHEVQVSLDGVGKSHDALRGPGSYERALKGLAHLAEAGVDVSVASMVHEGAVDDFDELERVVRGLGAREWNIDVPSRAGRWRGSSTIDSDKLAKALSRAYGGGAHFTAEGDWACGAHLGAVMADGTVCKCGFYAGSPHGTLEAGLAEAWGSIPRVRITDLRCDCELLQQCRGGCRYRAEMAGDPLGKDYVMCAAHGVPY
ncbi:MAG: radical SAM protein [Candidatus Abyssubacteria bacterium]